MSKDCMGTSKAADLWGCTRDDVSRLCRKGKIKGAEQDGKGKPWRIPEGTPNPFTKSIDIMKNQRKQ